MDQPNPQVGLFLDCQMLLTVRPASSRSLEVYVIFYQGGKSLDCCFMFTSCLFITDKVSQNQFPKILY